MRDSTDTASVARLKDHTTHRVQRLSRVRPALVRVLLLVSTSLMALVLGELALRLWSPGYSPLFLDVYRLDSDGYVGLRPNVTRTDSSAEWRVTVAINHEGLRDVERPSIGSEGGILGIGDSFTFGWGVELDQTFLSVLERHFAGRATRVVKAGIPGTGTSDQAWWLERYGTKYRPATVILGFYVGNDFVDVQMGGVPGQFTVEDGLMIKRALGDERPPRLYEFKERLKRSSLIAQRVAEVTWAYERSFTRPEDRVPPGLRNGDRWLWEFGKIHLRKWPPETERAVQRTFGELDRILDWTNTHDARLVLLVIPPSNQVYPWQLERFKKAYSLRDDELDLDRPQRLLGEWATKKGVTFVDLLPAFRRHAMDRPTERLYFYPNGHMNANGHRLTGELLASVLDKL